MFWERGFPKRAAINERDGTPQKTFATRANSAA
jgi:hypothetical protein